MSMMLAQSLKSDNKDSAAFERSGARSKPPGAGAVLKIEMLAQRHARCQNGLPLGRRSCDGARATSSVSRLWLRWPHDRRSRGGR